MYKLSFFFIFVALFSFNLKAQELEVQTPKKSAYHLEFLPLVVFDTDPNEGQSYGVQPSFIIKDSQNQSKGAFAATLAYNTYLNFFGELGAVLNPTEDSEFSAVFGWAQKKQRKFKLSYKNQRFFKDRFSIFTHYEYRVDPLKHYWGRGSASISDEDTNYSADLSRVEFQLGYYLKQNLRVAWKESFLRQNLQVGVIEKLPSTLSYFSSDLSVLNSVSLKHQLSFIYDSRPNENLSKRGLYVEPYFVFAQRKGVKGIDYYGFGFDFKALIPAYNERLVTAFRASMTKLYSSHEIPFYLKPSLGGEKELRAFGEGRFVDLGKFVFGLEERIRVKTFKILKTKFDFSIDPFFELGEVFSDFNQIQFKKLQPLGGIGFRGFVAPNILGRVDVAMGREGPQVFIDLDYPF